MMERSPSLLFQLDGSDRAVRKIVRIESLRQPVNNSIWWFDKFADIVARGSGKWRPIREIVQPVDPARISSTINRA